MPQFVARRLSGTRTVPVCTRTESGVEWQTRDVPAGIMVFFPHGHSVRVPDEETLYRPVRQGGLGLSREILYVDPATGEQYEAGQHVVIEEA